MKTSYSTSILRYAFIFVFTWFGLTQLLNASQWVGLIPAWVTNLSGLSPHSFVLLNGTTEIIFAILFALDLFTPYIAALGALHLLSIVADVGINDIGVRDIGLAVSLIALAVATWPVSSSKNEISS